jgi:hypothetical protein
MEKNRGARGTGSNQHEVRSREVTAPQPPKLEDLGVTKMQSSRWQMNVGRRAMVDAPFEVTIPRGAGRGAAWGSPDIHAPANRRYIEGQRQYLSANKPQTLATCVIDYSNLANPMIVARRHPMSRGLTPQAG